MLLSKFRGMLLVMAAISGIQVMAQKNLILNPGFEKWSDGVPQSWNYSGKSYISECSDPVFQGIRSAGFKVPETSTTAELYQDIPVSGGAVCTFSASILDSTLHGEIGLIINWRNSSGSLGTVSASHSENSYAWKTLSISDAVAPAGTQTARVRIRAYMENGSGAGYVYADHVLFSRDLPLPVSLLSLTVESHPGFHLVQWQTATETGIQGFRIFRSLSEEGDCEPVSMELIPGCGSGSTGASYQYPIYNIVPGVPVWYHLIEVTDFGEEVDLGTAAAKKIQSEDLPSESGFIQNYPNPFNPQTCIVFRLQPEDAGQIRADITNILGQRIDRLIDKVLDAGEYSFFWTGRDERGFSVPSGVYFCHIYSEQGVVGMRRMVKCE